MAGKCRPYQQEAVDSLFDYWDRAPSTPEKPASPLIVMPTGAGKSPTLGEIVRILVDVCGTRGAIVTHRAELIIQDAKAVRMMYPKADIGIVSAGLGRAEYGHAITICGIQSVARRPERLGKLDWMLIDEVHLVGVKATGQYRTVIANRRQVNPDMRLIGLTATPSRSDQGYLTEGDDALFTAICCNISVRRLIDEYWLARPITGVASASVNTDGISIVNHDFAAKELELASDVDKINDAVAADVAGQLQAGRKGAMVFGTSVAHACRLRNALRMAGVSCDVVTGATSRGERDAIYAAFKAQRLQALVSMDVLTTGFDDPHVDVVAIVRATMSSTLFVQMGGRGGRPMYACGMPAHDSTVEYRREQMALGPKPNGFVLLDYGGNLARHGPLDDIRVKSKSSKGDGDAPVKLCPKCQAMCAASARECLHCGFEFPAPTRKANDRPSSLPALSIDMPAPPPKQPPVKHDVGRVEWAKHQKYGDDTAKPTLRIDYFPPGALVVRKIVSEWVCIEHEDVSPFAFRQAFKWWANNVGTEMPACVDDAIAVLDAGYLKPIMAVVTQKDKKWDRVIEVIHGETRQPGDDDDEPAIDFKPMAPGDRSLPAHGEVWGDDDLSW